MGRYRSVAFVVGALALFLACAGASQAILVKFGNIVMEADGGFKPQSLPRNEFAPIRLTARGEFRTVNGELPPPVTRAVVDWDRNGLVTTRGLPVCDPERLLATTTQVARRACPKALVGTGHASGFVDFPDQEPFGAGSPLLVFNGPPQGRNPTVVIHAHAHVPAPTTFVVPVVISRINAGRYRYRTVLNAPEIAGGYGVVTKFRVKIERRYKRRGQLHSFVSARCPDRRLQVRGTISFADGSSASGSLYKPCKIAD